MNPNVTVQNKLCKCGQPVDKTGTRCKPCSAEYKWYYNNKKQFGLEREELDSMFVEQNGCCKICRTPFTGQRPCVDHCHTTNKVRGLLCHHCNTGLGQFFDNKELLTSAIEYLNDTLSKTN